MHTRLFFSIIISGLLFMQCSGNQSAEKPIPTVNIGEQTWMDADISTRVYLNGDSILEAKSEQAWMDACAQSKGCYRILNNGAFLYNGFAMTDPRGLCPKGFKIPSTDDFKQLIDNYPMGAASMELVTYTYYVEEWMGGDDGELETIEIVPTGQSGFKAMPGGFIDESGVSTEGPCNYYWLANQQDSSYMAESLGYCSNFMTGGMFYSKSYGFSIRAISEVFIPQEKKSAEVPSASSNSGEGHKESPKPRYKSIQEADLSEQGSESIHECTWGNLYFKSTITYGARGQFLGTDAEITSNINGSAKKATLSEVMNPSKQAEFLSMFNKALKSNMEENKKKDAECYGHLKIKSYGINDVFFDLTPTGFVFSVSTGEGIWPCPEVMTYDHPMTFEQAAPFFILE